MKIISEDLNVDNQVKYIKRKIQLLDKHNNAQDGNKVIKDNGIIDTIENHLLRYKEELAELYRDPKFLNEYYGRRKWTPSASAKKEYAQKMNSIEDFLIDNGISSSANNDSYYFTIDGQKYRVSNHSVESSDKGMYKTDNLTGERVKVRSSYHDGRDDDTIYIHASKTRIKDIYNDLKAGKKLDGRGYIINEASNSKKKKRKKAGGYFVNPNAGNVEVGVDAFNNAVSANGGPSVSPSGPMGEDLQDNNTNSTQDVYGLYMHSTMTDGEFIYLNKNKQNLIRVYDAFMKILEDYDSEFKHIEAYEALDDTVRITRTIELSNENNDYTMLDENTLESDGVKYNINWTRKYEDRF